MSSPPAGWYADPQNAAQLRYWDGVTWTEHRAPGQPAYAAPVPAVAPGVYAPLFPNVYDHVVDPAQVLSPEQRDRFRQHTLTSFPTWLAVVLHFLTIGLFTTIYHGLKLSKLPLVKENDFGAGKGIGFLFIPFFNIYWLFRFVLGITDRLNFQLRLRGQAPPISRGLALTACIVTLIPYVGLISWAILMPIVAGQWQSAANRLAAENEGRLWAAHPALQAPPPLPPLQPPPS
jgi:Protein of unknown function (DUF2510)